MDYEPAIPAVCAHFEPELRFKCGAHGTRIAPSDCLCASYLPDHVGSEANHPAEVPRLKEWIDHFKVVLRP
jgi:hypothetical protein